MEKYITLLRKYIEQESDETTKVLLQVSLQSLIVGIMPTDARIKFSLLTNSNVLLLDTVDFTDLNLLKDAKCHEIDAETAATIISLVGDEVKQRNLTAKAVQLTLKLVNGTISTDETDKLHELNTLFEQVEQLRVDGNATELQIRSTATVEEFDAVVAQLGV
jgi:hypothetical protein